MSQGYAGRVEILAKRQEIRALLSKGHTIQHIYTELKAEGSISIKQRQFYKLVKWLVENRPALSPVSDPPRHLPPSRNPASSSSSQSAPRPSAAGASAAASAASASEKTFTIRPITDEDIS